MSREARRQEKKFAKGRKVNAGFDRVEVPKTVKKQAKTESPAAESEGAFSGGLIGLAEK